MCTTNKFDSSIFNDPDINNMNEVYSYLSEKISADPKGLGNIYNWTTAVDVSNCKIAGKPCTTVNYTRFFSPFLGECTILNNKKIRQVTRGYLGGLSGTIKIDPNEFEDDMDGIGVILTATPNDGGLISPYLQGQVYLEPGSKYKLELKKTVYKRQDPFKNQTCRNSSELTYGERKFPYTVALCERLCIIESMISECKCVYFIFPSSGQKVCLNNTEIECAKETVFEEFVEAGELSKCTSKCRMPCQETVFNLAAYPTAMKKQDSNAINIRVYFNDFAYTEIEESLSYELASFVAELGGNLGLFGGFCVLALAEILCLLVNLLAAAIKGCARRNNATNPGM